MEKPSAWRLLVAAIIYLALFLLGSTSGLLGPACYAYVGTLLPIPFAFVYLYVAANVQGFGAAALLNGFVLVVGLVVGEGNAPLIIGLVVLAALAEILRRVLGYETLKGVRASFIPLAFSFYPYVAHWWTDTEGSLAAATAEMPAGYADAMVPVINNTVMLVVMICLVVPVAILAMRLAEKAMAKSAGRLS